MQDLLAFALSVLFGFLPMFFLAGMIYWLDRYEKEPLPLLGGAFGWGAIVAVAGALVLQLTLSQGVLMLTGSQALEEIAGSSLFAPVTEEILKGLAVLLIFLLFPHEFDSVLDGIVYAAITALGFAATEDVLYYFGTYLESGYGGMIALVVIRFVVFGWQHAFFTAFTGIGLALARMNHNPAVKLGAPLAGLALAVFTHSLHNTILIVLNNFAGLAAAAFVAWTGWLAMAGFITWQIYREKVWMREYLREELERETITAEQYRAACEPFGQSKARFRAFANGKFRRTTRFYQLCAELAHKKRQLATMGEEDGNTGRINLLRAELGKISQQV